MKNETSIVDDPSVIIQLVNEIIDSPDVRLERLKDIAHNRKNEKILLTLPIITFFQTLLTVIRPQKYGFLIQARIKKDLGYDKPKNNDSGDAQKDGKPIEIKSSIITKTNPTFNIRQTRPWQGCEYDILCIDMRTPSIPEVYFFKLSHVDMERELILCNAGKSHSHGEEMSITMKCDENDENFSHWCKNYKITSPWEDELNGRDFTFQLNSEKQQVTQKS